MALITRHFVSREFKAQAVQVFKNIQAVSEAAGCSLSDIVKLTVYLTDLANMPILNEVMTQHFKTPYPARTTVQISALPKAALIEVDAVLVLAIPALMS